MLQTPSAQRPESDTNHAEDDPRDGHSPAAGVGLIRLGDANRAKNERENPADERNAKQSDDNPEGFLVFAEDVDHSGRVMAPAGRAELEKVDAPFSDANLFLRVHCAAGIHRGDHIKVLLA